MTDDPRLPDDELASAYLDGDVDETQRAQVQGSAELTALVSSFAGVRAALSDVPAPAADVRDTALAAALAEFDALRTASTAPASASAPAVPRVPVLPLFRRRWTKPLLAAAAAVLVGGVITVGVLQQHGSGDKSADVSRATELARGGADTQVATAGAPTSTIGSIGGPAVAPVQVRDEQQLLALAEQLVPLPRDSAGGSTSDTYAATSETTAPPAAATPTASTGRRTAFSCPLGEHQEIVADIIWIDTPAVAVRDTVTGEVQAIDAQCTVLASVTP